MDKAKSQRKKEVNFKHDYKTNINKFMNKAKSQREKEVNFKHFGSELHIHVYLSFTLIHL
jgi:hypothetical protein